MKQRDNDTTRRLWALLTREPHLTHRAIMERLSLSSTGTVSLHLRCLEELGYIQHEATRTGRLIPQSRRILMPFVIQERAA